MTGPRLRSASVAAQRLYSGPLLLAEGAPPRQVEVWRRGGAAVVFEAGVDVAAVRDPVIGLTEDHRLLITGTDHTTGEPTRWEGHGADRPGGSWSGVTLTWPSGLDGGDGTWSPATVVWSQYGVRVAAPAGHVIRLPGARTEVSGGQRWIVTADGARFAADAPRRGCGCSGRR